MDDILEAFGIFALGVVCTFWWVKKFFGERAMKLQQQYTEQLSAVREQYEQEKVATQELHTIAIEQVQEKMKQTLMEEYAALKAKEQEVNKKEEVIAQEHAVLTKQKFSLEAEQKDFVQQLERYTDCTKEQAKEILLDMVRKNAMDDMAQLARQIENEEKGLIKQKAIRMLAGVMQRCASEAVQSCTVTSVALVNEEMKGRLIGREGRNIRALEAATGVDIIIDNTPEVITLSAFNPIRRKIASMAIEILMQDGRIHPARIEEVVARCTNDINMIIREKGEQAVFDAGIQGVAPEIIFLLGSLAYRTSFSQNMLQHALEVSSIAGMLATELGVDAKDAKRAGLFHDIGKAIESEYEGSHAMVGADMLKKHGEAEHIVHAVAAHHEDIPIESVLDCIVQIADSISGARPGARKEVLENYIKRLETLESIATREHGVVKAFAIQAGREVRVIVDAEVVSDSQASLLAQTIVGNIRRELVLPSQVQVTVVREVRAIAVAS